MRLFRRRWAPYIPGFSQGTPEPGHLRRVTYGGGERATSIHRTGTIDIQVDDQDRILRVWFRCLNLPFTVTQVDDHDAYNPAGVAVETVTYVDRRQP